MNAAEIADLIKHGYTVEEIAKLYGFTASKVRTIMSRAHISCKAVRRAALREKAKPMLDSGMTLKATARALGVSYPTVARAVPEHRKQPHIKLTPQALCEVERLLYKKVPMYIIADRLGVTKDAIYKRLGGRR